MLFILLEYVCASIRLFSKEPTLANEQASSVKQILFCGAMVPTLLPVRPGPHLIDAGLL